MSFGRMKRYKSRMLCGGLILMIVYLTRSLWTGSADNARKGVNRHFHHIGMQNDISNADNIHKNKYSFGTCTERRNFVFIKCMKCATQTMATIIRRFGYNRNLSFVTPMHNKIYLGWPYLMTESDYRPSSRGYNIIMEHSIYNKTTMEKLMPKDTVYISIIREPFSHVKSTIHYFKILQIANVTTNNQLSEYFRNLEKYEAVYKSHASRGPRHCIPDGFSLSKNLLSHCLGMPLGFPAGVREDISKDPEAIQSYIYQLGRDFRVVLIMEYFHESLILLKRKMCWSHFDILYRRVNGGSYTYKAKTPDPQLVKIYRNWSSADYKLYDYFNRTFWKQIDDQGPDFFDEVEHYTRIQQKVNVFCFKKGSGDLNIEPSRWSSGFKMTFSYCDNFSKNLLLSIQARHDIDEQDLLRREASKISKHKPNGLC